MTAAHQSTSRMMTDIYEEYRIMPGLQLHQLRVGAVGKMICDNFDRPLDTHSVVLACLLHDMGNIIKSDLTTFPEFLGDKGYDYWKKVKDDFIARYGSHEHAATLSVVKELGVSETVQTLINNVGFSNLEVVQGSDSFEMKIVEYADLRVAPHGILSMRERLAEAGKRYIGRHRDMPTDTSRLEALTAAADEVERQIFAHCTLTPETITDETAAPVVDELREYALA